MIIDAHQHFWSYEAQKHSWINDDMALLRRDFLPDELQQIYTQLDIDGCIAVQADQSEEESFFLLDLAEKFDFIKGVVGWVDLRSPQIQARLEYFSHYNKMKGFRHVVQGESDPNFMLRESFMKGISLLNQYHFTYDILIFPHQLGASLELVRRFPQQKFVIDHIAKPYIKDGFFDGWANQMKAIAQYDNVWCKVSGMVTEANWQAWEATDFNPYLDLIFESFDSSRLLFGSDWPVCLVAASYEKMKAILDQYLSHFSDDAKAKFWGENAKAFYNIS